MPPKAKKKKVTEAQGSYKPVNEIEVGHTILISGVWRTVVTVEPHENLDAYRVLYTSDGKRWVRSIFDNMGVQHQGQVDAT